MRLGIFFLLLVYCVTVKAQNIAVADTLPELKALHFIYQNDFDRYDKVNIKSVDAPVQRLLEIFYCRWKEIPVAFGPQQQHYLDLLLANAEKIEKDDKPGLITSYYKICAYLFIAEYYSSHGESWSALKYAQKSYPLLLEAMDKKYSQLEYVFVVALYKYYTEHYREKSFFYRAALIPLRSGNKEEGLKLLKQCATNPSIIQTEATIFLAHILMHHENKPYDALTYSEELSRSYPNNLKFMELYAENLIRCKKYTEAIPLVATLTKQSSFYFAGPAQYLEGLLEEEHYKNTAKAKMAYEFCLQKEYKPIEYFQKKASQRLKDLD